MIKYQVSRNQRISRNSIYIKETEDTQCKEHNICCSFVISINILIVLSIDQSIKCCLQITLKSELDTYIKRTCRCVCFLDLSDSQNMKIRKIRWLIINLFLVDGLFIYILLITKHALLKMMYISEIDKDRQWAGNWFWGLIRNIARYWFTSLLIVNCVELSSNENITLLSRLIFEDCTHHKIECHIVCATYIKVLRFRLIWNFFIRMCNAWVFSELTLWI
jgi:hypothetical protein